MSTWNTLSKIKYKPFSQTELNELARAGWWMSASEKRGARKIYTFHQVDFEFQYLVETVIIRGNMMSCGPIFHGWQMVSGYYEIDKMQPSKITATIYYVYVR